MLLLADSSFAIDQQAQIVAWLVPRWQLEKEFPETVVADRFVVCDRRAARQAQIVVKLVSWWQPALQNWPLGCRWYTQQITSPATGFCCCACRSTNNPHSIKTCTLFEEKRKKKKKKFDEERIPQECCWQEKTRCVAKLAVRLPLVHTTHHNFCHLLLLLRTSFDVQSAFDKTCTLLARKKKQKYILRMKRIPHCCCCLRVELFAILNQVLQVPVRCAKIINCYQFENQNNSGTLSTRYFELL
jgi:hypothetical protein